MMIFTLMLGFAAGYVAPLVEPSVRKAMEDATLARLKIAEAEYDMLTLLLLLLLAAVLVWALDADGGAIALILGAILGMFGKRLLAAVTEKNGGA
jgi:protein-S-isoprenylcysteine O-methyltransferase Ste14